MVLGRLITNSIPVLDHGCISTSPAGNSFDSSRQVLRQRHVVHGDCWGVRAHTCESTIYTFPRVFRYLLISLSHSAAQNLAPCHVLRVRQRRHNGARRLKTDERRWLLEKAGVPRLVFASLDINSSSPSYAVA